MIGPKEEWMEEWCKLEYLVIGMMASLGGVLLVVQCVCCKLKRRSDNRVSLTFADDAEGCVPRPMPCGQDEEDEEVKSKESGLSQVGTLSNLEKGKDGKRDGGDGIAVVADIPSDVSSGEKSKTATTRTRTTASMRTEGESRTASQCGPPEQPLSKTALDTGTTVHDKDPPPRSPFPCTAQSDSKLNGKALHYFEIGDRLKHGYADSEDPRYKTWVNLGTMHPTLNRKPNAKDVVVLKNPMLLSCRPALGESVSCHAESPASKSIPQSSITDMF